MRRWTRHVAVLLLVATVGGFPHFAEDDAACIPVADEAYAGHAETDHSLRGGGSEAQDHCALCHWSRSLRSPGQSAAHSAAVAAPPAAVLSSSERAHRAPALENLPARAPPGPLL